jgi:hypothetical protein
MSPSLSMSVGGAVPPVPLETTVKPQNAYPWQRPKPKLPPKRRVYLHEGRIQLRFTARAGMLRSRYE